MKCLVVITASLLVGFASTSALGEELTTNELLGAAAGGVIGSTIGQGDGKKVATVLGVLIGLDLARNGVDGRRFNRSAESICRKNVPAVYRNNHGAANAWISGCIDRLYQEQAELEQQAYSEGMNLTN